MLKKFFRSMPNLPKEYGQNSWAIVTGGANGIGKAFCQEFAKQRLNIQIIDFDQKQMKKLKEQLLSRYPGIQVELILADFRKSHVKNFFEVISKMFKDLDISILVNNVGTWQYRDFTKQSFNDIQNMFMVNIIPQSILTQIVLQKMLQRKHQKRSAIITVSSLWGEQLLPGQTLYCATKRYNDFFSRTLSQEYFNKDDNRIDFISIKPSVVTTRLSYYSKIPFVSLYPKDIVQGCLYDLKNKLATTNGLLQHEYQSIACGLIPSFIVLYAFNVIEWLFLKSYLKNKEKEYIRKEMVQREKDK